MSLVHETNTSSVGYSLGDMKLVAYDIAFTSHQLVEPETGWFLLNGSVVSQATYPILFARFGSTFNTGGEGVGNFRLPDMTDGKIPLPKGLTNFTTYGASGGEINHTLSSGELAAHAHADTFTATASAHSHTNASASIALAASSHTHSGTGVTFGGGAGSGGGIVGDQPDSSTSPASGLATHGHTASTSVASTTAPNLTVGGSISAAGSGGSHNNMQPYLVMGGWLVRHG